MVKPIIAFALFVVVNCDVNEIRGNGESIAHPKYAFTYAVHDSATGDSKNHIESRDGDVVQGEYSIVDADGYKRTVKYTADDANGFNAFVDRQPIEHESPLPVPVKKPVLVAVKEPVLVKHPVVVKNVVPFSYTVVSSIPINYVTSPIVKSVPSHLRYTPGQVIYRSAPFTYNVANFIGVRHIAYSGPVAFSQVHALPSAVVRGGW